MPQKILVYLGMLIFAALIAGAYGMIHDQISYSISQEYFTRFKFHQFGIPWAEQSPRRGAALVGFMATWWMGVLVGLPLGLFSFRFPTPTMLARQLAIAFVIVISVALLTGLLGLGFATIIVNQNSIDDYQRFVRPDVQDPIQFVRVGFMHNASYLGGLLGLIAGIIYLRRPPRQ